MQIHKEASIYARELFFLQGMLLNPIKLQPGSLHNGVHYEESGGEIVRSSSFSFTFPSSTFIKYCRQRTGIASMEFLQCWQILSDPHRSPKRTQGIC